MKLKNIFIITILALIGILSQSASAKVYLVAVGISDYPGKANDLILPRADADTITSLYRKNSNAYTVKLLDSKATTTNIINTLNQTFQQAQPDDVVMLFFSGHGYKGGFVAYDGALSYSRIRKAFSNSKATRKIILADACFAGKMRTNKKKQNDQSQLRDAKKADVMLFLSSRDNEVSWEKPNMKNGFFTKYLQMGLRGYADVNNDRKITARELFNYVSKKVKDATGQKQHPVMWGNFPSDMTVIQW